MNSIKVLPKVAQRLVLSIKSGNRTCGSEVASNGYTYHAKRIGDYVSVEVENDSFGLINVYQF